MGSCCCYSSSSFYDVGRPLISPPRRARYFSPSRTVGCGYCGKKFANTKGIMEVKWGIMYDVFTCLSCGKKTEFIS